jgi:hypothetical protein
MAEEGSQSEGQEGSSETSTDSIEHLSSMHITTYEEVKAESMAQAGTYPMGWQEAIAKDERAERAQNRQKNEGGMVVRKMWDAHHHITREEKRKHDEWEQTQRDIRAGRMKRSPSDIPYAKGNLETFWGKVTWAFFRLLGVE